MTKCFDWLRLFEGTSFYILLVGETFIDIAAFITILLVSLLTFGFPYHYLNFNQDADSQLYSNTFDYWFLDILFNQFMFSLGDFDRSNFDVSE